MSDFMDWSWRAREVAMAQRVGESGTSLRKMEKIDLIDSENFDGRRTGHRFCKINRHSYFPRGISFSRIPQQPLNRSTPDKLSLES